MKIKGVIKNLNLKKLKSDNIKNISRNFSGAVVSSVGSVQFQRATCSSLHLFSRSIGPLQCLVDVNYRVLICCTCHFQSGSLLFILASSVCKSLQCLNSILTQGCKGGHSLRLTCSVVLWGGRDAANKYPRCVWGVLAVSGPHRHAHGVYAFPVYTAQAPGYSAGEVSRAGPWLSACSRPKPLRFRFSGAP